MLIGARIWDTLTGPFRPFGSKRQRQARKGQQAAMKDTMDRWVDHLMTGATVEETQWWPIEVYDPDTGEYLGTVGHDPHFDQ